MDRLPTHLLVALRSCLVLGGVLTATALIAAPTFAQDETQFAPIFSTARASRNAVAWGDMDGDGDLDVAVGYGGLTPDRPEIWRNDGGQFSPIIPWDEEDDFRPLQVTSLAWGDMDGDGDLDLAVGAFGRNNCHGFDPDQIIDRGLPSANVMNHCAAPNRIWQNQGDGRFTRYWSSDETGIPAGESFTTAVAWGDADDDGDLDLAVGNWRQPNQIYRNNLDTQPADRAARFSILTPFPNDGSQATTSLAWGNLDDANGLDLVIGNGGPQSSFCWAFLFEGVMADGQPNYENRIADKCQHPEVNRLYLSDGSGGFTEPADFLPADVDGTTSVALGDLDLDGDLDLVVGNKEPARVGAANRIYRNLGTGQMRRVADTGDFGTGARQTRGLALGDSDGDGDLDILTVGDGFQTEEVQLFLNDISAPDRGMMHFTVADNVVPLAHRNVNAAAWGDMDGDGALDLAMVSDDFSFVYRNRGSTLFAEFSPFGVSLGEVQAAAWGDANNDGQLDLAVGTFGGRDYLFVNQGGALEQEVGLPRGAAPGLRCWPNCRQDAAAPNAPAGLFQPTPVELPAADTPTDTPTEALAWGDWDGDGDLDLAVAKGCTSAGTDSAAVCGRTRVYENDATAGFTLRFDPAHGDPAQRFGWEADAAEQTNDLAWGDLDGDGDLDLVLSRQVIDNKPGGLRVLQNEPAAGGQTDAQVPRRTLRYDADRFGWQADDPWLRDAGKLALGDADNDGDLDIAVVSTLRAGGSGVLLYRNDSTRRDDDTVAIRFTPLPYRFLVAGIDQTDVAWGDMDGDGDLDLALANSADVNQLFRNDGPGRMVELAPEQEVLFNFFPNGWLGGRILCQVVFATGSRTPDPEDDRRGTMAAQLVGQPLACDRELSSRLLDADVWAAMETARSYALGPHTLRLFDQAGGLLAVFTADANPDEPAPAAPVALEDGVWRLRQIYSGSVVFTPLPNALGYNTDFTHHLAWGDADGDGDLDLALTNLNAADQLFLNEGGQFRELAGALGQSDFSVAPAWGDADGDGDLDLFVGRRNVILRNNIQGGNLLPNNPPLLQVSVSRRAGGADFYSRGDFIEDRFVPVVVRIKDAEADPVGQLKGTYSLDGGGTWQSAVLLTGAQMRQARATVLEYTAIVDPTPLPTITNVKTSLAGRTYTYYWDTFQSGFFGQSANVVLRVDALPQVATSEDVPDGTFRYRGLATGEFQQPLVSSATYPFPVRATEIRVMRPDPGGGAPIPAANAIVFKLPLLADGSIDTGTPIVENGAVLRTDLNGYLHGRGQLRVGDRLVALWPVADENGVGLYHTNLDPQAPREFFGHKVMEDGVQKLVVGPEHPLYLFDLTVSTEWNAENDGLFLDNLGTALERSSEVLYDVSNGQMALGNVTVLQDREGWLNSDMVLFAGTGVRPRAAMGGMVTAAESAIVNVRTPDTSGGDTVTKEELAAAYTPGQIRMGPNWDPFGVSRAELTDDWWRALAHEYGHYFLFLTDNYLGYDEKGAIVSNDCRGSFMTSSQNRDYSQFLARMPVDDAAASGGLFWDAPADPAANDCLRSLAENLTGLSDWETIRQRYPAVTNTAYISTTTALRLDFTQVRILAPVTPSNPLPVENVDLRNASGEREIMSGGQAYLFKPADTRDPLDADTLIALGSPRRADYVRVRGAEGERRDETDILVKPQDRVLVIDTARQPALIGWSDELTAGSINLTAVPEWQPDITVQRSEVAGAVDAVTGVQLVKPALEITVDLPQTAPFVSVQVLSYYGSPYAAWPELAPKMQLTRVGNSGTYRGVVALKYPLFAGYIRIWADRVTRDPFLVLDGTAKQAVTDFYVNGDCTLCASGAWCIQSYGPQPPDLGAGRKADLTDLTPLLAGGGTDFRSGGGTDFRSGGGTDFRSGGGTDFRSGGGTDFRSGGGTDFRSGGGTDFRSGGGTDFRSGGGTDFRSGGGTDFRGWGANQRTFGAPIASSDGQVTIFNNWNALGEPGVETLQMLPSLPGLPAQLTVVGSGYRLQLSTSAARTIAFSYLQRDVPEGFEEMLAVYHSADDGMTWRALATDLDPGENLATAPVPGSGLFALVTVVNIPLPLPGWNLFAYPLPGARPIEEALAALDADFGPVFGFDRDDPFDPWKLYVPGDGTPDWVSDLDELVFGNGYWIRVGGPTVLQLKVVDAAAHGAARDTAGAPPAPAPVSPAASDPGSLPARTPPAVYYGAVDSGGGAVARGMDVTAWIADRLCGTGVIEADAGGALRYKVKVLAAESAGLPGCGVPDAPITFAIGPRGADSETRPRVDQTAQWQNEAPQQLDLTVGAVP